MMKAEKALINLINRYLTDFEETPWAVWWGWMPDCRLLNEEMKYSNEDSLD